MTVTIGPRYGALEILGHGDPLYVRVVDIPLLVHGQQASLMRIVDGHLVEVGVAVMPGDGSQVLFRVGLREAEAWYSAPYPGVWALSRGLSTLPICLEQTEAPA